MVKAFTLFIARIASLAYAFMFMVEQLPNPSWRVSIIIGIIFIILVGLYLYAQKDLIDMIEEKGY